MLLQTISYSLLILEAYWIPNFQIVCVCWSILLIDVVVSECIQMYL